MTTPQSSAKEEGIFVDEERGGHRGSSSDESLDDMMRNLPCMLIIDTDADGDQILAADDERGGIFRHQQQQDVPPVDIESSGTSRGNDKQSADVGIKKSNSSTKYPGIPAGGSFDTAETEECATLDGSEASTDAGEVNSRPVGAEGEDRYEDDEEGGHDANTASSQPQLGAKEIIIQRLQMAREKLNDMMNWYTFVALSFLTAVAAILCVAFGNHGVAAILLFVAVLLITILICWLRLDLRGVEMM